MTGIVKIAHGALPRRTDPGSRRTRTGARAVRPRRAVTALDVALAVALALAVATPTNARAQTGAAEPETRSTLDRVFTAEQAERGAETFEAECSACHAPGFFTASTFVRSWSGRALYWLSKQIRTTMPESNPGSLKREEVSDILAYVLSLNGYPGGEQPLPAEDDLLRLIVLEELPEGDGPR